MFRFKFLIPSEKQAKKNDTKEEKDVPIYQQKKNLGKCSRGDHLHTRVSHRLNCSITHIKLNKITKDNISVLLRDCPSSSYSGAMFVVTDISL